jgi:release factor glutamine methyltransferase
LQAELMLAQVLRQPRLNLYLNFARELTEPELVQLRNWVKRRGQREPLQYILGSVNFCGLEFTVNSQVLIPRPETEVLAEEAWRLLEAARDPMPDPLRVLDFGTGSGCLAVTLAVRCPIAQICAIDLSPAALDVAHTNARRHHVETRVRFLAGLGFAPLSPTGRFDLIVTNPPYIPSAMLTTLEPEIHSHEPHLALDGGEDGLDLFRQLARTAGGYLRPGGRLLTEFGDGQESALASLFQSNGWEVERWIPDNAGKPRILVARPR